MNHFFKVPEIRLYWMAIALVAQMLAAPLDALTVVVLTHELAHAYSHLGRDIDGRRWETDAFAKTDFSIAEGIAPVLHGGRQLEGRDAISGGCRGLSDAPQAPDGPYRVHEHWASEGASPGEIVRLASRSRADPRGWGVPGGRARFRHELEKLGF